jgi:hypothetical protein
MLDKILRHIDYEYWLSKQKGRVRAISYCGTLSSILSETGPQFRKLARDLQNAVRRFLYRMQDLMACYSHRLLILHAFIASRCFN